MKGWDLIKIKQRGFTIVELLIVIVIIGILAAIVVVGYGAVQNNAQDTAFKTELSRIGDEIKLVALDQDDMPPGGATSLLAGDSTILPGVNVDPKVELYDTSVANFYYCTGEISGTDQFAVVARSSSEKVFKYMSEGAVSEITTPMTWNSGNDGVGVCTAAGFSNPFTWSYGYNPDPAYQWFGWAYNGALITNLIPNPSFETDVTSWALYTGVSAPTRSTVNSWTGAGRLSAVGSNSSVTPRVYINIPGIVAGDKIALSYRVRSDGQVPTSAWIGVKLTSGGSEGASVYSGTGDDTSWTPDVNGWSLATTTFTVPSGGDGLRVTLGLRSATNYTGTMGIDGVLLVKGVDSVPGFADGSTPGWIWNGTAHASTSTGPSK